MRKICLLLSLVGASSVWAMCPVSGQKSTDVLKPYGSCDLAATRVLTKSEFGGNLPAGSHVETYACSINNGPLVMVEIYSTLQLLSGPCSGGIGGKALLKTYSGQTDSERSI